MPKTRIDALLDSRSATIIDGNEWGTCFDGEIEGSTDFSSVSQPQRATQNAAVLCIRHHGPSIDAPTGGHHSVAGRVPLVESKVDTVVNDFCSKLTETPIVEQSAQARSSY